MPRTPLLVAALLPTLLITACGGDDSAATEPTPPPPSTTSSATPTPSSPAPSQTAAPPAPGTAADGSDLGACRDGTCEVVVEEGDVLRFNDKVDTDPLTVVSAGKTFTVTDASGFAASTGGGGQIGTGGVSIEIGESKGDRTAIRISPRD